MRSKRLMIARTRSRPELDALIERAKAHVMTDEERREQAVSFVFGNLPKESKRTKEEVRALLSKR